MTVAGRKFSFAHLTRVLREEMTPAQPRLWLANIIGRFLPTGSGGRFRNRVYSTLGIRVGRTTVFHGPTTFSCHRGKKVEICFGERCRINSPLYLDATASISVGDGVSIGHHVVIITAGHEIGPPESRAGVHRPAPVVIGDGAWIGANVTLLPGVTVGAGAVVAAGAVVTKNVAENMLVGGVPARVIRSLVV